MITEREIQGGVYIPTVMLDDGQKDFIQACSQELAQASSVKGEEKVLLFLGSQDCLDRIISYDEMEEYLGYGSKSVDKRASSRRELKGRFNTYVENANIRLYSVSRKGFVVLPELPNVEIFVNPNLEVDFPGELENEEWRRAYRKLKQTFLVSEHGSYTLKGAVRPEAQNLLDLMLKNPNTTLASEDIIAHKYDNPEWLGFEMSFNNLVSKDKGNLIRDALVAGVHIGIETHKGLRYELTDLRVIDYTA